MAPGHIAVRSGNSRKILEPDRTTMLPDAAGKLAALIFRPFFATRPDPCVLARGGALWQEPAARGCRFRPILNIVPGMLP
jgi:hypothetical protein